MKTKKLLSLLLVLLMALMPAPPTTLAAGSVGSTICAENGTNAVINTAGDLYTWGVTDMNAEGGVIKLPTKVQGLSNVVVKKDEKVTTKQNIGMVGKNMGKNTHELHFEILKEFTHLDPALWLSKK